MTAREDVARVALLFVVLGSEVPRVARPEDEEVDEVPSGLGSCGFRPARRADRRGISRLGALNRLLFSMESFFRRRFPLRFEEVSTLCSVLVRFERLDGPISLHRSITLHYRYFGAASHTWSWPQRCSSGGSEVLRCYWGSEVRLRP